MDHSAAVISANDLTIDVLRDVERASIRSFVQEHAGLLVGRVLDYGCGLPGRCAKPEPYRDLVTGEYVPYDLDGYAQPAGPFDAVLCTQVAQYLIDPLMALTYLCSLLRAGGALVLTYPTHWPEIETDDRQRFTREGMAALAVMAGFAVVSNEPRWRLRFGDFTIAGGYGMVAQC